LALREQKGESAFTEQVGFEKQYRPSIQPGEDSEAGRTKERREPKKVAPKKGKNMKKDNRPKHRINRRTRAKRRKQTAEDAKTRRGQRNNVPPTSKRGGSR
jgi:hypothetical protein